MDSSIDPSPEVAQTATATEGSIEDKSTVITADENAEDAVSQESQEDTSIDPTPIEDKSNAITADEYAEDAVSQDSQEETPDEVEPTVEKEGATDELKPTESMEVDDDDSRQDDSAPSEIEPQNTIEDDHKSVENNEECSQDNVNDDADHIESPMETNEQDLSPKVLDTEVDAQLNASHNQSADLEDQQKPEEVDMENLADTSISDKEKPHAEDPFDSLKQDSSFSHNKDVSRAETPDDIAAPANNNTLDESGVNELNTTDTTDSIVEDVVEKESEVAAEDDKDTTNTDENATAAPTDNTHNDDSVVDEVAANNHSVSESTEELAADGEALDDLERGKGVDEELSLLPDADREISEADKERARKAEVETESVVIGEDESAVASTKSTTEISSVEVAVNPEEIDAPTPDVDDIKEINGDLTDAKCVQCSETRPGKFTLIHNSESQFLCSAECVTAFRAASTSKTVGDNRIQIVHMYEIERSCKECALTKVCTFRIGQSDATPEYLCSNGCVTKHIESEPEKYVVRRIRLVIETRSESAEAAKCIQCFETKQCLYSFQQDGEEFHLCQENCMNLLLKEQPDLFRLKRRSVRVRDLPKRAGHGSATIEDPADAGSPAKFDIKIIARTESEAAAARIDRDASFVRQCAQCSSLVTINDKSLQWETMDFCNETCLGQYQRIIGASCTTCQGVVQMTSLGKYCVRFGYEVRQFCRSACLDQYKKGLKVCSFCQKDISADTNGFLASIGGQFKDFCVASCMKKYDDMCNPKKKSVTGICAVCMNVDQISVEVTVNEHNHSFCSNPCFSAFQFVNNINADKCQMCLKFFERKSTNAFTIYQNANNLTMMYCSKVCMNIYIITHRKIVPCQWCKVKKYNFDMIQKKTVGPNPIMLCSLNCLNLCEVSMNAMSMKKQQCDQCLALITPQYHLTMSDASVRNFCTYQCVMSFQSRFSRAPLTLESQQPSPVPNSPVPTGLPKRIKSLHQMPSNKLPVISAASSLATPGSNATTGKQIKISVKGKQSAKTFQQQPANKVPIISNVTSLASGITTRNRRIALTNSLQPVVEIEPIPSPVLRKIAANYKKNASPIEPKAPTPPKIQIKTQIITVPSVPKRVNNMSTMCKPATKSQDTQTQPKLVTVGCQTDATIERTIFIPIPVPIYVPQPMHMYSLPTPIPVPFPLPIPVPIFIPTTRNSAKGIMKEIKKIQEKIPTDPFEAELLMMAEMVAGDKKRNDSDSGSDDDTDYVSHSLNDGAAMGDDMLQMAMKMAQEYEEPAVDLESSMTTNTIAHSTPAHLQQFGQPQINDHLNAHHLTLEEPLIGATPAQRGRKRGPARNSRSPATTPPSKRGRKQQDAVQATPPPAQPEPPREPVEKPDVNMCLKFTFGVNAWKQWVMTKNADLEKSSIRRKQFKSELLQLTADELNYSLCLFVKEVRKPNGSEYAPDTIYYLVLGIQQYLYENGRIDNVFTDPYYERFTDCLDSVAKKFSVLYNDSQYIVTRVEEEHLWECKQLGAHSPHVLLSTLMFFNTKHFNLTSVDEHSQLSFSHIMKHWKRSPGQVGTIKTSGTRNVLLRFYPPQATLDSNSRKKKVYEQQENEDNPLRCPVKLYEFYLSKCPESVKTRNDVFYLQPERSCVPDSPVWYSTQALPTSSLCKMLHRVKMVKEINIALLTS